MSLIITLKKVEHRAQADDLVITLAEIPRERVEFCPRLGVFAFIEQAPDRTDRLKLGRGALGSVHHLREDRVAVAARGRSGGAHELKVFYKHDGVVRHLAEDLR